MRSGLHLGVTQWKHLAIRAFPPREPPWFTESSPPVLFSNNQLVPKVQPEFESYSKGYEDGFYDAQWRHVDASKTEERAVELDPGFFVGVMDYEPQSQPQSHRRLGQVHPQGAGLPDAHPQSPIFSLYVPPQITASQYLLDRGGMVTAEERIPQQQLRTQSVSRARTKSFPNKSRSPSSSSRRSHHSPLRKDSSDQNPYRQYRSGPVYEAAGRFPGVTYSQYCDDRQTSGQNFNIRESQNQNYENRQPGQRLNTRSSQQSYQTNQQVPPYRDTYQGVPQYGANQSPDHSDSGREEPAPAPQKSPSDSRLSAGEEGEAPRPPNRPSSRKLRNRQFKPVSIGRVRTSDEISDTEKDERKEQLNNMQSDKEQASVSTKGEREVNILGKVLPTTYTQETIQQVEHQREQKEEVQRVEQAIVESFRHEKEKEAKATPTQDGANETNKAGPVIPERKKRGGYETSEKVLGNGSEGDIEQHRKTLNSVYLMDYKY